MQKEAKKYQSVLTQTERIRKTYVGRSSRSSIRSVFPGFRLRQRNQKRKPGEGVDPAAIFLRAPCAFFSILENDDSNKYFFIFVKLELFPDE